jgi:hypothetical protein
MRCKPLPPATFTAFEQLVYPQWLHQLQQKKPVVAAPAGLESA